VEVYGDIMEKGVGLCCEEAVRLLLESKGSATSPIAFVEREIDEIPDEIPDDAIEARDAIFEEREHLFKILADHSKPLNKRLVKLLDYAIETSGFEFPETRPSEINATDKISDNAHQTWIETLGKGESYGPAWDTAYKELKERGWQTNTIFSDNDGEKIIAYLLFRYYEKSLFDGNSLTKVEFAIYFWIMVQKIQGTKIDAIKLLSKQTEYSEEIMEIFEQEFMENPAFLPAIFKRILAE
jgi:lysine-N-methylase